MFVICTTSASVQHVAEGNHPVRPSCLHNDFNSYPRRVSRENPDSIERRNRARRQGKLLPRCRAFLFAPAAKLTAQNRLRASGARIAEETYGQEQRADGRAGGGDGGAPPAGDKRDGGIARAGSRRLGRDGDGGNQKHSR